MTKLKKFLSSSIPALLVAAVSIFPVFYLYIQNINNMFLYEALIVMAITSAIGLLVYGILFLVFSILRKKSPHFTDASPSVCASLVGSVFMAIFMNINMVRPLTTAIFDRPSDSRRVIILSLGICFLIIAACTAVIIFAVKKQSDFLSFISKVMLLILCGMIIINTITAVPSILNKHDYSNNNVVIDGINTDNIDLSYRPNVYFFILDEYAEFNTISKLYDYDNADFRDFLEKNNFNISDSSRTLIVGPTSNQMANLCSLQSVCTPEMTELECLEYVNEDAPLFSAWRALGYSQWQVSSKDIYPIASAIDRIGGLSSVFTSQTENGYTILDLIIDNSMIFEFREFFKNYSGTDFRTEKALAISDVFDYYDNNEFLSYNAPTFFYSYVECPHTPFLFKADGTLQAEAYHDWQNPTLYLDQYKYVTTRMQNAVEHIIANDPDAIIIIQSDHGLRHTPGFTDDDASCILNAVYCGGNEIDIEGLSAVDTFRLILTMCGLECEPVGY